MLFFSLRPNYETVRYDQMAKGTTSSRAPRAADNPYALQHISSRRGHRGKAEDVGVYDAATQVPGHGGSSRHDACKEPRMRRGAAWLGAWSTRLSAREDAAVAWQVHAGLRVA